MKLLNTVLVTGEAMSMHELLEQGRNLKVRAVDRINFFFRLSKWLVLAVAESMNYN